jgi:acetoin utilization deacetylase AcuC-like enzyme
MPSKTGVVYHDLFLDHDTGPGHPERPDRLRAVVNHLKEKNIWNDLHHLLIDSAEEDAVLAVHPPEHLRFVRTACRDGKKLLDDGDTHISRSSCDVALLAAGGALAAADAVMRGLLRNTFCLLRPPGHHAERNRAMGFCLFNTIAITARHIQKTYGVRRIAIVDWDVHHGNGTQEIFYEDPDVLFISTHQVPLWPGTGARDEQGTGRGKGTTMNIPMPPGSGESRYVKAFREEIIPAIERFRPEIILISAGFDAHRDDPLAQIDLTEQSFGILTSLVTETAEKVCDGRLVSLLEGGYNLGALAASVEAHLSVFMQRA